MRKDLRLFICSPGDVNRERGPMPLYIADVHLHRARLFGRMNADERKQKFPDIDPKAELAKARALIEKHG